MWFLVGGIARGFLVGLVVVATSLFFVQITIDNLPLTLLSIVLTSLLFSLLGLLNGIYAKSFDDVSIVPTFVLTPLDLPWRNFLLNKYSARRMAVDFTN